MFISQSFAYVLIFFKNVFYYSNLLYITEKKEDFPSYFCNTYAEFARTTSTRTTGFVTTSHNQRACPVLGTIAFLIYNILTTEGWCSCINSEPRQICIHAHLKSVGKRKVSLPCIYRVFLTHSQSCAISQTRDANSSLVHGYLSNKRYAYYTHWYIYEYPLYDDKILLFKFGHYIFWYHF